MKKFVCLLALLCLCTGAAHALEYTDVCPPGAPTYVEPDGSFMCYTLDGNGDPDWYYIYWYSAYQQEWIYDYVQTGQLYTNFTPILPIPCAPIGGISGCAALCWTREDCASCIEDEGRKVYDDCVRYHGTGCFGQLLAYRINAWVMCKDKPSKPN